MTENQDNGRLSGAEDNVRFEQRSQRKHVRLELPFQAVVAGERRDGLDLSLSGFAVDGEPPADVDREVAAELIFVFHDYSVNLPVTARVIRDRSDEGTAFEFTDISQNELNILRKLISSYLSGTIISVDGLLEPVDAQVGRKSDKPGGADGDSAADKRAARGRYAMIGVATVAVLLIAVVAVYQQAFVVNSPFAATTAPRIDVRAPAPGRFDDLGVQPGDAVATDQRIGQVVDTDLNTELAVAEARLSYQQELLKSVDDSSEQARATASAVALSLTGGTSASDMPDLSPIVQSGRAPAVLDAQLAITRTRLEALKTRKAARQLHSPCACIVRYAAGGSGETWREEGDLLYTLVPSDPQRVSVEAQVPLSIVGSIDRMAEAQIELPNGDIIEGRVVDVMLDGTRRPMAGFPTWVRQDQSKATVLVQPDESLAELGVGQMVDVSFTHTPAWLSGIFGMLFGNLR